MTVATIEKVDETSEQVEAPRSRSGVAGWALILPFLFFATHGVFSFQTGFHADAVMRQATTAAPPAARDIGILGYVILPGIAYSVVMYLLLTNLRSVCDMAIRMRALTFLALLTILSAAWSQSPGKSLLNGGFYLIGTLLAYYIVLRFPPEEIMNLIMRTGAVVCFLGAIMVFLFPQHGVIHSEVRTMGAWCGIFPDRTSAAKCIVYLLSPALIFWGSRIRWGQLVYIAVLLLFIVMGKAVSALGVMFGFAVIMLALQVSRRLERNLALLLGAFAVTFCLFFVLFGVPIMAQVAGMFGRDLTLTGRTEIWSILMDSVMKHPLLGYGFYAFWQGLTGESANIILITHWFFGYAHNGMLEIVLQLGLVGISVFLFTFVSACKNAWYCIKYGRTPGVEWYCGILVLTVLYNIDEETVMWPNDLLSILYVVACCGLAVEARRIRNDRAALHYAALEEADALPLQHAIAT